MRVLAVGAHPDDLEILCGGTLAKYARRGDHVSIAVTTNGEMGSSRHSRKEIAEIRHEEAAAAAKVIGADFYWMNYPDEFLFSTEQTSLEFLDLVRQARPDVIITHAPTDYHPDHRATGSILWDIRVMTTVPNIKTKHPPCERIPEIFYMETLAGIDFVPQHYVDISECFTLKREMLACHKSQSTWLEEQYKIGYLEMIEITSRYRGFQCGVKYAEGLQTSSTWPKFMGTSLLP
jgi:LmbE family N-acetylglucosaminyl deacetylase